MIFVDTNYFLRFLLKDVDSQHKLAEKLFIGAAEGSFNLFTSIIVIFEIHWVFSSFYKKDKVNIVGVLKEILSFPFLKIEEKQILSKAVRICEGNNISFEDSYNLMFANAKGAKEFRTFDSKLAKLFTSKI